MRPAELPELPVTAAIPALQRALGEHRQAILEAPPGAGKSTLVPLALLDEPWLGAQKILMLQPRRLATRAVAARMAQLCAQPVGELVGYRMRMERRIGRGTRIEVVTEGMLGRALQADPALEGFGCVIFDEYHERSLQADLGLALTLDSQQHLRPELRVLIMSATPDLAGLRRLLPGAPVIGAAGQSHPVLTRYLARTPAGSLPRVVAGAVLRALAEEHGDVLVFLPGAGEIRQLQRLLAGAPAAVLPLYGELSRTQQDAALCPAPDGRRRVVLATNLAETSLTIEGIRVVIDSGYERRQKFAPRSGMSRLETVRIARSAADQRRGRAGRLGPGVCLRLWTEATQRSLAEHPPAEITEADLAPLALDLACWGSPATGLRWLDPPAAARLAQARELLAEIEALFPERVLAREQIGWEPREKAVLARRQRWLDALLLADEPLAAPDPQRVCSALLDGLTALGSRSLPWTPGSRTLQARVLLARNLEPAGGWPDVSDAALELGLRDWLAPWLVGMSRLDHVAKLDLAGALRGLLGRDQQRRLEELAPTHVRVPSGSRIAIDYLDGPEPALAVRLQEVFGLQQTPRIGGGRLPLTMKLLSPAGRPVQVTRDLASFWANTWDEVRRELRGRYPKHYWPEDPQQATATRHVRPR